MYAKAADMMAWHCSLLEIFKYWGASLSATDQCSDPARPASSQVLCTVSCNSFLILLYWTHSNKKIIFVFHCLITFTYFCTGICKSHAMLPSESNHSSAVLCNWCCTSFLRKHNSLAHYLNRFVCNSSYGRPVPLLLPSHHYLLQ